MLSRDDGGSWETVTTVFDGLSTEYIVAVERSPGELLFVYDEQVEPGIRYAKRARWVIRVVDARIT